MELLSAASMYYNFDMQNQKQTHSFLESLGAIMGYLVAWASMTLALTVASRLLNLGPGFSNLLPYAGLAMAMSQSGRLLRKWLAN